MVLHVFLTLRPPCLLIWWFFLALLKKMMLDKRRRMELYRFFLLNDCEEEEKKKLQQYCIKENKLGIGWGFNTKNNQEVFMENPTLKNFIKIPRSYGCGGGFIPSVNALEKMNNDGALCWTRLNGNYYLGEVEKNSLEFLKSPSARELPVTLNCKWKPFRIDEVSGSIVSRFSKRGLPLSRINDETALEYSCYLYYGTKVKSQNFFRLLHHEDLEDLSGLFLQSEKGFMVYPSTYKSGTDAYEYILVNPKTSGKIAVRNAINDDYINCDDFALYDKYEKIFIVSDNINGEKNQKIEEIKKKDLELWAGSHLDILPEKIKTFYIISHPETKK